MIKTTTSNELILNVYNESSEASQKSFHSECILNELLSEEREIMEDLKTSLENLSFQPRQSSIDAILQYSQSFMTAH